MFRRFSDSCYYISSGGQRLNYDESNMFCANISSHMLIINNEEEQVNKNCLECHGKLTNFSHLIDVILTSVLVRCPSLCRTISKARLVEKSISGWASMTCRRKMYGDGWMEVCLLSGRYCSTACASDLSHSDWWAVHYPVLHNKSDSSQSMAHNLFLPYKSTLSLRRKEKNTLECTSN